MKIFHSLVESFKEYLYVLSRVVKIPWVVEPFITEPEKPVEPEEVNEVAELMKHDEFVGLLNDFGSNKKSSVFNQYMDTNDHVARMIRDHHENKKTTIRGGDEDEERLDVN